MHTAQPLPPGLLTLVRLVRALTAFGAVVLCVVPLLFWLDADWVRAAGGELGGIAGQPLTIDARAQVLGASLSAVAVVLGLYTLWQLWQLFGEYRAGRVFGATAQVHLRAFARGLLALALAAPPLRTGYALALTLGNPPGQRLLSITLSWNDYLAILIAAVLLAIAAVMRQAVALAEENEGFV